MTVPRVPLSPLVAGEQTLSQASARYLTRVLRLRSGNLFASFDPRTGTSASAQLLAIDGDAVTVRIDEPTSAPTLITPLVLVQGYPKGDKLGDIVRDATELGVTLIVPAVCARSVARPQAEKLAARADRLQTIAAEAARQCQRAQAPSVLAPLPWIDALAVAAAVASRGIVLWEEASVPVRDDLLAYARNVAAAAESERGIAFVIGPEGGLTEEEVAAAIALGWPARSLGDIVLRTETAATSVLGAWRVLAG